MRLEIPESVARRVAERTGEAPPGYYWRPIKAWDVDLGERELVRDKRSTLETLNDILVSYYLPAWREQANQKVTFLSALGEVTP